MERLGVRDLERFCSEERACRANFQHRAPQASGAPPPLVDQFVLLGSDVLAPSSWQPAGWKRRTAKATPTVLFRHPPALLPDFSYDLLLAFCFPENALRTKLQVSTDDELRHAVAACTASHLHAANAFVLVFTNHTTTRFGVCMRKTRVFSKGLTEVVSEDVCYVLITAYPFFMLHLLFLETALSIADLTALASTPGEALRSLPPNAFPPNTRFFLAKLDEYAALAPPTPSRPLRFIFPMKINSFVLPFKRQPFVHFYLEYALLTVFTRMSVRDFFLLLSALLLECKVFVVCADQAALSATLLALLCALHPFAFAGVVINVLCKSLEATIEAPTPLLMGMRKVPARLRFPKDYVFVADLDAGRFAGKNTAMLPSAGYWVDEVSARLKAWKRQPNQTMSEMIDSELDLAEAVANVVQKAVEDLVCDFDVYCLRNVYADEDDISFFLEESFVEAHPAEDVPFFRQFVKTQLFANYKEARLEKRDKVPG